MAQDTRVGTTLAGYRIERLIGKGGMGRVYLAEDTRLGRKVALKLLDPELAEDERFRQRFVKESRMAASLDHPNVIPIYEAGESDGVLFIAMRYVEGTDLGELIQSEGPLPLDRATHIISQVASALDAAHEAGLIHRDVKPGNVLVGRSDHAYLSDFGLIKRRESHTGLTKTGAFMGSVNYAAPEQIKGEAVDHRVDIYSLGCLLYECLAGEVPFPNDAEVAVLYAHLNNPVPSVRAKRPELPPAVDAFIRRATAKRPSDRYTTAGELGRAIQDIRVEGAPPPPVPSQRGPRRPVAVAVALGALAILAIATVVFFTVHRSGSPAAIPSPKPSTSPKGGAGPIPPVGSVAEFDPMTMRIRRVVRDALTGPFLLPHDSQGTIAAGEGGVWVVGGALGARSLTQIDASLAVVKRQITLGGAALGAHPGVATGYHTIWLPGGFGVARFDAATGVPLKPLVLVRGDAGIGGAVASVGAGAGGVWAGATTDEGAAVYRIQPSDGKVVARIPVEGAASEVIVAEGVVWVADEFNGTVSRIDPADNRVVATISFHGSIDGFAAGNGGAWILDTFARTVTPIDLASNELGGSIPVGGQPSAVAVGFGAVWVTDYNGTLYRIDPDTRAPVETRIGAPLYGLAVDVQNGVIWLAVSPKPTGL